MTEMLHWYAETTGGVRQGNAPVHPGCGAVHLSADLPAGGGGARKNPVRRPFFLRSRCKDVENQRQTSKTLKT